MLLAKDMFCTAAGFITTIVVILFGGDNLQCLYTLLFMLIIDFITGLMLTVIFKKSTKTEDGEFDYTKGLKGICKKIVVLMIVAAAHQLDHLLGTIYIMPTTCYAFTANELLSVIINARGMGVKIPKIFNDVINILQKKE